MGCGPYKGTICHLWADWKPIMPAGSQLLGVLCDAAMLFVEGCGVCCLAGNTKAVLNPARFSMPLLLLTRCPGKSGEGNAEVLAYLTNALRNAGTNEMARKERDDNIVSAPCPSYPFLFNWPAPVFGL